jgi:hypothetical protein
MRAIPFAIPVVWTKPGLFLLQSARLCLEIGSDCLRIRRFFR